MSLKKVGILLVAFCFSAALISIPGLNLLVGNFFDKQLTIHRNDADAFYQSELKALLELPPNTKIEQIVHTQDWVDDFYVITLAPLSSTPPDVWVKNLWADNRFAPGAKVNQFEFEAYHDSEIDPTRIGQFKSSLHHGHRRIYFDKALDRYIVEIGTD